MTKRSGGAAGETKLSNAIGSLKGRWRWPRGVPQTVDAYIDYVRGGSYLEIEGREPPARKSREQ